MKILLIDIEVAPNTAHVWGIFDQNISINQLLESSYTLCYAAKWYGESKIMFDSTSFTTTVLGLTYPYYTKSFY